MKKFLLIFLLFALVCPLSACKKKDNLKEICKDLTTYSINLEVDTEEKKVKAQQTVNYINHTNSILKTIKFHLYPQFFEEGGTEYIISQTKMNNAYPNGMSYADFNVTRVKVEETESSIQFENVLDSILCVNLNKSLMPDESVEIFIEYNFVLPNCCHRFGYGENTLNLGNFYPIACVFEEGNFNTSTYHANGDPFYSDTANYVVNITTDKQYIVAGTGEKHEEKIESEQKSTTFSALAVRDFALVLSDKFQVVNEKFKNTNIEYYYFADTHAAQSLKAGIDAIKTFSNLFGAYPHSTFTIVETDFLYGGMEYPNLVMISTAIENVDDYLNVIIHETAHQWWFSLVGSDQFKYPWLDEALTEYSTVLFYDHNSGYNLTHEKMINISKENYTLFISVYEDVLGTIDTSMRAVNEYSTEPEYTYCTYVKGVLMWDSINNLIGEKKLLAGLKIYFENNKFKNATPDDLFSAMNEGAKQNLNNVFTSWIDGHVVIR